MDPKGSAALDTPSVLSAPGASPTLSLRDVLDPEAIKAYNRKATGEKFLINPSL